MLVRHNHRTDQSLPEGCFALQMDKQAEVYYSDKFCTGSKCHSCSV